MKLLKPAAVFFFVSFSVIFSVDLIAQEGSTVATFIDQFSKKWGNLRMSSSKFDFGTMKNTETKTDTIRIFNSGKLPMTIGVSAKMPPYMKLIIPNQPLKPNSQGVLILTYDASKKNDYGYVMERIQLSTDDVLLPQKYILVSVYLIENFSAQNSSDTLVAKARIPELSFDYGKIKAGDKTAHDFKIYNDGNKILVLHKTKSNCDCMKASFTKKEINPGDFAVLHIDFDSHEKQGKESRKLSLFISDPAAPEVIFEMHGEISR